MPVGQYNLPSPYSWDRESVVWARTRPARTMRVALFRSQEYRKGETELLILVTPHLAKPLIPAEVQLPTDGFVEPSDVGWYLGGNLEGKGSSGGN